MLSFCEDVYIITLKYHIQILPPLNSNLGSAIGFKYMCLYVEQKIWFHHYFSWLMNHLLLTVYVESQLQNI